MSEVRRNRRVCRVNWMMFQHNHAKIREEDAITHAVDALAILNEIYDISTGATE